MVLVGEVEDAVSFRGLLKPVDKGGHFRASCFLDASDADVDNDEGHVRDSEVVFGAFPQTEQQGNSDGFQPLYRAGE